MNKLTSKIALPIILAGIFAITIFIALDYNKLDTGFYVVLSFLTVFIFFFGYATGQEFSSPVRKLLERAKELSKGNLDSRIYLETKDELAELARVFNQIAEELETSRAQEESAEKSVGIKVQARTQELQETINALEQKIKNRTVELERKMGEADTVQKEVAELKRQIEVLKPKTKKIKLKTYA